jgi:hypothetical protein
MQAEPSKFDGFAKSYQKSHPGESWTPDPGFAGMTREVIFPLFTRSSNLEPWLSMNALRIDLVVSIKYHIKKSL